MHRRDVEDAGFRVDGGAVPAVGDGAGNACGALLATGTGIGCLIEGRDAPADPLIAVG
jgi:hypothetical protein